jgi:hypothetical protein
LGSFETGDSSVPRNWLAEWRNIGKGTDELVSGAPKNRQFDAMLADFTALAAVDNHVLFELLSQLAGLSIHVSKHRLHK